MTVKVFTSLGLPIRDRNVHVDLPIPSLLQSSSQPLYSNISPVHSQEAFTSFQSLAPLAAQPPCLLPSPNLMPPSIIPNESPYDVRLCSSAPETYSEPRETAAPTLSQMLPPKRILPFPPKKPKPATPEPETAASNLNQESIQDGICPAVTAKKKPTRARTTKAKASASNPRPPRTAKLPANTNNSKRSEPASRTSTPKRTKRSANIVSPISPLIISPPEPAPLPSKPARRASKPAHPAISNPIATNSLTAVEPAEFMSRLDSWVREYQHLPAPQPRDAAAAMEDLTAYAAQSKEERLAVIDEMICECLEDENFGKLVEDVDESWRRIGLGF